ncbi:hypothetical protein QC764_0092760 [Podospora pseudoanserina]|uniref:Multicopper oxidase n=1 Tax=Podospora pseudoanserina TaxID=2609844 RepID=A0ABR0HT00_9PEZI|nr:hypothetical protein QC764_0092760 [Podospora pseudoanserina]
MSFDVTRRREAPSGVWKKMVLVNGQSPGPLIEVSTGDIVRVKVNNLIWDESTTINWHGIHQRNTTWMDGVAGISQCAIPPAKSFTYEFEIIDQRGTFCMVPVNARRRTLPDVILINGLAVFTNCNFTSSTWSSFMPPICEPSSRQFTTPMPNTTTRFRLINHSSFTYLYFTIDSHPYLTIIEIDGVEVEPITVPGIHLNIGQRYSVLVSPIHSTTTGSFVMRATIPKSCFLPYVPYTSEILESVNHQGTALLSYSPNPNSSLPQNIKPVVDIPQNCTNPPFNLPVPIRKMAAFPPDTAHPSRNTHQINFQFQQAGPTSYSPLPHSAQLWLSLPQTLDSGSDPGSYNNYNFPLNQQVLFLPDPNKTVQIAINSRDIMEHPFHLHGHTFQIVA